MKYFFVSLLQFLLVSALLAQQQVNLPRYIESEYQADTIYTHLGGLGPNGRGGIGVDTNIISGMKLKMVVDTFEDIGLSNPPAYVDSAGSLSPMVIGDTIDLPVDMQLFYGDLGFHVIFEGIPTTAGEAYPCNLQTLFTLGDDFGMGILGDWSDTCYVDNAQSIADRKQPDIKIYPNPNDGRFQVELPRKGETVIRLFDSHGSLVDTKELFGAMTYTLNFDVPVGVYYLELSATESRKVEKVIINK